MQLKVRLFVELYLNLSDEINIIVGNTEYYYEKQNIYALKITLFL
jgi:hypothetical protein